MQKPIIRAVNISKTFGATKALRGVSFEFYPSEIFSIVGANGAGKSTFIKILCGYYSEYGGEIYVDDKLVKFNSPKDAYDAGIQVVHQNIEQGVVQNMSVAENLALDEVLSFESSLIYDKKRIKQRALEIAKKMNLEYLDMDANIQDITQSEKQMIIIARALSKKPKLLILDEPTSSISEKEAELLFQKLYKLRDEGVSILYISHYLSEIKKISNRVGVIRDGAFGGILKQPLEIPSIVKAMVGDIGEIEIKQRDTKSSKNLLLELKNLEIEGGREPLDLKVYSGEIVGILGLIGAGKTELAETLFGIRKALGGEVRIKEKKITINSIKKAIKNGIHMVPENRAINAIIPEQSIKNNITLPFLDFFSRFAVLKQKSEIKATKRMIKDMGIKCEGYEALIESLSGGNQQKVVVSRWLLMKHNAVILDEPFQGVDIKSRRDITLYLKEHTVHNAVLMISSDIDELLEATDRIVVMNKGRFLGEVQTSNADRDMLLRMMTKE